MASATTNNDGPRIVGIPNVERLHSVDASFWRRWACGHARTPGQERQPWELCLSCAEQARRNASHWKAFSLAVLIAFVTTFGGLWASCSAGGTP